MASQLQRVPSQTTLNSQVEVSLRDAITSGEMAPGQMYSVGSIAQQLGVSRTPVREAVLQLAKAGLVEVLKNQGFVVVERDSTDVARIFQIREWLEIPAAGLAATGADDEGRARIQSMYQRMVHAAEEGDLPALERCDARFHSAILEASGNPRLTEIVDELRDLLIIRRHTTTRSSTMIEVAHDHDGVLEAILARDAAAAEHEMRQHLRATRDGVLAILP